MREGRAGPAWGTDDGERTTPHPHHVIIRDRKSCVAFAYTPLFHPRQPAVPCALRSAGSHAPSSNSRPRALPPGQHLHRPPRTRPHPRLVLHHQRRPGRPARRLPGQPRGVLLLQLHVHQVAQLRARRQSQTASELPRGERLAAAAAAAGSTLPPRRALFTCPRDVESLGTTTTWPVRRSPSAAAVSRSVPFFPARPRRSVTTRLDIPPPRPAGPRAHRDTEPLATRAIRTLNAVSRVPSNFDRVRLERVARCSAIHSTPSLPRPLPSGPSVAPRGPRSDGPTSWQRRSGRPARLRRTLGHAAGRGRLAAADVHVHG